VPEQSLSREPGNREAENSGGWVERLLDDDGPVLLELREAISDGFFEGWRYQDGSEAHPNDLSVEKWGDEVSDRVKAKLAAALTQPPADPHEAERLCDGTGSHLPGRTCRDCVDPEVPRCEGTGIVLGMRGGVDGAVEVERDCPGCPECACGEAGPDELRCGRSKGHSGEHAASVAPGPFDLKFWGASEPDCQSTRCGHPNRGGSDHDCRPFRSCGREGLIARLWDALLILCTGWEGGPLDKLLDELDEDHTMAVRERLESAVEGLFGRKLVMNRRDISDEYETVTTKEGEEFVRTALLSAALRPANLTQPVPGNSGGVEEGLPQPRDYYDHVVYRLTCFLNGRERPTLEEIRDEFQGLRDGTGPTLGDILAEGRCEECGTLAGLWHKLGCSKSDAASTQPPSPQAEQVDTGEAFEDGGEDAEQAAEDLRTGKQSPAEPQGDVVEGIPGLKQGRDACDVAYHGHGKSLGDAFALGLAVALPEIRSAHHLEVKERLESEELIAAVYRDRHNLPDGARVELCWPECVQIKADLQAAAALAALAPVSSEPEEGKDA